MKRSKYTEEQIIGAIKQHEAGTKTQDICRKLGISEQTFYKWKSKFGGMEVSDAKRLRALEEENSRLKRLLAEAELDKAALKEVLSKKW
jgi:putative transposase